MHLRNSALNLLFQLWVTLSRYPHYWPGTVVAVKCPLYIPFSMWVWAGEGLCQSHPRIYYTWHWVERQVPQLKKMWSDPCPVHANSYEMAKACLTQVTLYGTMDMGCRLSCMNHEWQLGWVLLYSHSGIPMIRSISGSHHFKWGTHLLTLMI